MGHVVAAVAAEDAGRGGLAAVIGGNGHHETAGGQVVPGAKEETFLVSDPLDQAVDPAPQTVVAAGDVQSFRPFGAAQHVDPVAVEALRGELSDGGLGLVGLVQERDDAVLGSFQEPLRRLGKGKILVTPFGHRLLLPRPIGTL
jgi:hypothetical protein